MWIRKRSFYGLHFPLWSLIYFIFYFSLYFVVLILLILLGLTNRLDQ